MKRGASGIEHRREGPVVTVAAMKDVVSKLGDGNGCVASGKPWGNSQLSVLCGGWDGGGESIEKARTKLQKFRGFLFSPRE